MYHNVIPDEIFLSTFTEKAAKQLNDGLRSLLGLVSNETGIPYDISKMSIGTVHSICQKILSDRRFSENAIRQTSPSLKDELSQYFFLYNRIWKDLIDEGGYKDAEDAGRSINLYFSGSDYYSRHFAVVNLISVFNRFSEELIKPSEVKTDSEDLKRILKMYQCYLDKLSEGRIKYVDFSLLQQKAYDYIAPYPGSINVFKHVIIDEYQDTNNIQEKIFFKLAEGSKNICVVGDDDQALYRFRGATVENLVEFGDRCEHYIQQRPKRIDLDINFRSRKTIVNFYTDFISKIDWKRENGKGFYRVNDKVITANSKDELPAVITSNHAKANIVYEEIAKFVKKLKQNGIVKDYNQIAFLFPYMQGSSRVGGFMNALEAEGIRVYAPRAGTFLEVDEAIAIFGLFLRVFGKPKYEKKNNSLGMRKFRDWMRNCEAVADEIIKNDKILEGYIEDKRTELATILADRDLFIKLLKRKKWELNDSFSKDMIRDFSSVSGISQKSKRNLSNHFFAKAIERRETEGHAYSIKYIVNRITSVDWSILDLFYQLNGFKHFREMYRLAENGEDEGPICNLALITEYLSRFMEERGTVITSSFLEDNKFINVFFASYIYAIFRRGESEYEDTDNIFPKGRISFLTIHQAKGLEFPVVVLGSVFKNNNREASVPEQLVRDILRKEGEPLDKISLFDNMRMFYVGLSRAKNLMVLPRFTHGSASSEPFTDILSEDKLPKIENFDINTIPVEELDDEELGKTYSYTGDYILYQKCPRNYMLFKKYGFVPSRSQTMMFGSLVHKTIEDLHRLLIHQRETEST